MTTTARSDIVTAIYDVLVAQQAATPTQLRAVYTARPGSFPETPCAYVGAADEQITYTAGTRTRTFTGLSAVIVDTYMDEQQSSDRMDLLVDLLVDRFTAAYAQVSGGNTILALSSVADSEVELAGPGGPIIYRAVLLGFGTTFITEGRT